MPHLTPAKHLQGHRGAAGEEALQNAPRNPWTKGQGLAPEEAMLLPLMRSRCDKSYADHWNYSRFPHDLQQNYIIQKHSSLAHIKEEL